MTHYFNVFKNNCYLNSNFNKPVSMSGMKKLCFGKVDTPSSLYSYTMITIPYIFHSIITVAQLNFQETQVIETHFTTAQSLAILPDLCILY